MVQDRQNVRVHKKSNGLLKGNESQRYSTQGTKESGQHSGRNGRREKTE